MTITQAQSKYTTDDLLHLMSRLRDPKTGCPWDLKQTYDSIVPHTLEEAYEVADAIGKQDYDHLKEELGDLLFQVIFYSQMGKEDNYFDFSDIVHTLVSKLVRRHPHVFPTGELHSESNNKPLTHDEINSRWEQIKQQERNEKEAKQILVGKQPTENGLLDDIPTALPALQRAEKLQKRASTVGFDWPETIQVIDKIEEEIAELREALLEGNQAHIQDEMGDVLFAMTNLARHINVKSEIALRGTNEKFVRRFSFIETTLKNDGRSLDNASLEEMEGLWQAAKQLEK
ncbi:MAG: ATP diphosphatase [Bermanella sp.]|jgi:ATP diphosphatase